MDICVYVSHHYTERLNVGEMSWIFLRRDFGNMCIISTVYSQISADIFTIISRGLISFIYFSRYER